MLKDIIDRVEIRFKNALPTKEVSSYQLGYLVGQQSVIEFLKELDMKLKASK